MKRPVILTVILFPFLFSGCVTSNPQTAEEFRIAIPGAFLGKVETFEVDRPFSKVAATFKKMGPECLNATVETVSKTNLSLQRIVTVYKPTVLVTAERAELHVQQHHAKGVMAVYQEPEGGYYLLVADAIPLDKKRTRIDLYGPSVGSKALIKAIKGWAATGEEVGCPDMTKF